nr:hypothetical protein [Tanacetum cinerariifolium]
MEAGIYPSKAVRLEWTIHLMDYFYKNCHKFQLDPSYEDDVESEMDGIATEMKPEYDNDATKANDQVIELLREDKYSLCGLLETHVKKKKLDSICKKVLGNWDWVSNNSSCPGGTRITVGWDPSHINVMVMDQTAQVMHCFIESLNGDLSFHCSFVYAHIHTVDRRSLWKSLMKYSRVMVNHAFLSYFPTSHAIFLPFMTSDHTPATFIIPEAVKPRPKPFMFQNYLTGKGGFIPAVKKIWDYDVEGFSMYSVVSKLKLLKKPFRKLNFDQGNLFENVKVLRKELSGIQAALVDDPDSRDLMENESLTDPPPATTTSVVRPPATTTYSDRTIFLTSNTSSIPKSIPSLLLDSVHRVFSLPTRGKLNRGRISSVEDLNGVTHFGNEVGYQFVSHFQNVLGKCSNVRPIEDPDSLFINKLCDADAFFMIREISDDEVKNAMFDIDGNKAPGPDGFSSQIFKAAWSTVGGDICKAVKEFFKSGKPLKEVNATIISLVPKLQTPRVVSDYRPIVCCNVVYKNALDDFGAVSGLLPSMPKSTVFFGNVKDATKDRILKVMSLTVGTLPVRYLGVPSISNRLFSKDCLPLIDKTSCGILALLKKGKAKVKWSDVCNPKMEGGLESLWVKWIYKHKLKGRNFWDTPDKGGSSWSWRKILKNRWMLRGHIIHRIGNGANTSLWFDNWHPICPLSNLITRRQIHYSGLSVNTKVADMIEKGNWIWPNVLTERFDGLLEIDPPPLDSGKVDKSMHTKALFHGKIWSRLKCLVKLDHAPNSSSDILRTFQDKSRSLEVICNLNKDSVRLKMLGLTINDSHQIAEAAQIWDFHVKEGWVKRKALFLIMAGINDSCMVLDIRVVDWLKFKREGYVGFFSIDQELIPIKWRDGFWKTFLFRNYSSRGFLRTEYLQFCYVLHLMVICFDSILICVISLLVLFPKQVLGRCFSFLTSMGFVHVKF